MIHNFLKLIIVELNDYINSVSQTSGTFVAAGNIGLSPTLGGNEAFLDNKIVVSLANLMEEPTLKNSSNYKSNNLNWEKEYPPVFINVYLLFTANFNPPSSVGINDNSYYTGLTRLSQVLEFFQGKQVFSVSNSTLGDFMPDDSPLDQDILKIQDLSIKMELVSLTFEQCNYLWGSFGGKQLPFALFKAHVLPISRQKLLVRGESIQAVQTNTKKFSEP